eukprot:30612-Pelagococcus_subviridis.AAC.36
MTGTATTPPAVASGKKTRGPKPKPRQLGQCSHLKTFLAHGGTRVFAPLARCCLAAKFPGQMPKTRMDATMVRRRRYSRLRSRDGRDANRAEPTWGPRRPRHPRRSRDRRSIDRTIERTIERTTLTSPVPAHPPAPGVPRLREALHARASPRAHEIPTPAARGVHEHRQRALRVRRRRARRVVLRRVLHLRVRVGVRQDRERRRRGRDRRGRDDGRRREESRRRRRRRRDRGRGRREQ